MKNNIAMNFLNSIAQQCTLSDERCDRTGQSPSDGLLWFIGKGPGSWQGVMINIDDLVGEFFDGETAWRFEDGSIVICDDDPTDFEYTEDIAVRYYGDQNEVFPATYARWFKAGAGIGRNGRGKFQDGIYITFDSKPKAEAVAEEKVVVVVPPNQVSTAELALNHEAAVQYLAGRHENAKALREGMVSITANTARSSILYQTWTIIRFEEGNAHWAQAEMVGRTTVLFSSEECFLAWVLRRFW